MYKIGDSYSLWISRRYCLSVSRVSAADYQSEQNGSYVSKNTGGVTMADFVSFFMVCFRLTVMLYWAEYQNTRMIVSSVCKVRL